MRAVVEIIRVGAAEALILYCLYHLVQDLCRRKHMAGKRYGIAKEHVEPIDFELLVMREDDTGVPQAEYPTFKARPQSAAGDLMKFAAAQDDGEAKLNAVVTMIKRMVINSDGVPIQWAPVELERPSAIADAEDYEPKFYGPDGALYPMSEAGKFTAYEAGSSRRRLMHLMFEDEDAVVDMADITEILKDLMAAASGRPTSAPSRS